MPPKTEIGSNRSNIMRAQCLTDVIDSLDNDIIFPYFVVVEQVVHNNSKTQKFFIII